MALAKKMPPSPLELLGGKEKAEKEKEKKKASGGKFKKLKSGGFIVNHHDDTGAPITGAEHEVADMDGLHDHLEEHFGEPNHNEEVPK